MHEFTDFDLLSRWLGGDSEAFAVLAVRHHGLVTAACRRQAPPGESEDCVQAVFLLLMRKPAAAARAPALEAWLQRVTYFAHSRVRILI
jgi:DNA-directed RNA polymerase specialized sigma24 family protein